MILGLWALGRHERQEPITNRWTEETIEETERLRRRETWGITCEPLGTTPNRGERRAAERYRDRLPATHPGLAVAIERDDAEDTSQWRRAVVHRWLLVGEMLKRAVAENIPITNAWMTVWLAEENPRAIGMLPPGPAPPDRIRKSGGRPELVVTLTDDGPTEALPAGARWYPNHRTLSLRWKIGDLVVDGPGRGNAVRSGDGEGDAVRTGTGHGYATRRGEGDGNAIRTGEGHGDAHREGPGNGHAVRDGRGHGNAYHDGTGGGEADRRGSGHGHAYRSGGGTASRSGTGAGEHRSNWIAPWSEEGIKRRKAGTNRTERKATTEEMLGRQFDEVPYTDTRIWTPWPDLTSPRTWIWERKDGTIARKSTGSDLRVEGNTVVLDSEEDGTVVVRGHADLDVERRGPGAGDAVRVGPGRGNATRSGSGHGNAIRRGSGDGDAVRRGTGTGNAVRVERGAGNARVTGTGRGSAARTGEGPGNAVRSGSGDGHAVHGGTGRGTARREGSGQGTAVRLTGQQPRSGPLIGYEASGEAASDTKRDEAGREC